MRCRSQSTMEFLTTFGWAFVIIIVALLVLYELGIFKTSALPNACLAYPGFLCTTPSLSTLGVMKFQFAQSTGSSITLVSVGCAETSSGAGNESTLVNMQLKSGALANLSVQCPILSSVIGTKFSGILWIRYTQGTESYVTNIGTVTGEVDTPGIAPISTETIVQSGSQSVHSSYSLSYTNPVTIGDDLVASFSASATSGCPVASITDTIGNTWIAATSKCIQASAGSGWVYTALFYAKTIASGPDTLTVSTSGGGTITSSSGLIAIYEISPGTTDIVMASPGSGTSAPAQNIYQTSSTSFQQGSALIGSTDEINGGSCCTAGANFIAYSMGSGSASEYSTNAASPTVFPISSAGGSTKGWADLGMAFEP